jgi:hypothetical protein
MAYSPYDYLIFRALEEDDNDEVFLYFLEYSESDYDDSIDEFLTAKTPNNFGKEYKYGAYQAILLGHTRDVRLRDEGRG